ncbi:DUF4442 domain-containing protein [Puia sp.]|jgi:hypothetical protein|uniref:DUF4442 domain-containing protein n=1 Tax=Puia sp. TaxID=2045100 RepID=UPI002F3EE1E5
MTTNPADASPFLRLIRSPLKVKLFLLTNLPSAFFSGLRIPEVDGDHCVVTVAYRWFTRNPFRSTYFACLSMAAEMSTGVLAMARVYKHTPSVSMLVVHSEAAYFKKATGLTRFVCNDGAAIKAAVDQAIATGDSATVKARSIGTNAAGDPIAEFFITWSFKVKK